MGYFKVDESNWPRVYVRVATNDVTDAELLESVEVLGAIAQRGVRYTLLIDARGAKPLSSAQRKLLADASEATAADAAKNCAASAILVSNALMSGIMTAIHWLKRTDYPERSFSERYEAEKWLDEMYGEAEVAALG